jgi:hypothetical protein
VRPREADGCPVGDRYTRARLPGPCGPGVHPACMVADTRPPPSVAATPTASGPARGVCPPVVTLVLLAAPHEADGALAHSLLDALTQALPDLDVQVSHELAPPTPAPADVVPVVLHRLALVRPPRQVLAEALMADRAADPAAVLAQWAGPVRAWLRQAQRAPSVWAFVEARPGAGMPRAIGAALGRFGLQADVASQWAMPEAPAIDPLVDALAASLVRQDGRIRALHDEVVAACAPGDADTDAPARAALSRWQALDAEAERARRELAEASLAMQQAQARLDAERHEASLAMQQAQAQLDAERHALTERATRAEQALADREAEVEQLVSQVLDLHDLVGTARPAGAAPPAPAMRPSEGRLQVVKAHEAGTHRHLHLRGEGLRAGDRPLPAIEFRLAEHHGRPALVVFSSQGPAEPLAAWAPDGQEAGRAFMQLVPADEAGRLRAQRLGASDWQVVRLLVRLVRTELGSGRLKAAPRWADVARRLDAALDVHADRLRYDRLDLAPADGSEEGAGAGRLAVALRQASRHDVALGDIVVELPWQAGTVSPALAVRLPAAGHPLPLPDWPLVDDGRLAPRCPLPMPLGADAAAARARWDTAGAPARALVLALLEALPGVRQAGADLALPDGVSATALGDALARLHRDARRADATWRLRGLWARVWRRAAGRGAGGAA